MSTIPTHCVYGTCDGRGCLDCHAAQAHHELWLVTVQSPPHQAHAWLIDAPCADIALRIGHYRYGIVTGITDEATRVQATPYSSLPEIMFPDCGEIERTDHEVCC